jgi:hypothetical protein
MQIDLFRTNLKSILLYLGWILLFIVLFFKGCNGKSTQTITLPAITKTLPANTIIKHEVVTVPKYYKDRTNEKKLSKDITEMYEHIEDENLKLTVNGIIGGNEVKEITPTYTIKERKVEVPTKQTRFRLLAGLGLGNTKEFNNPIFSAKLGFQNAKGNILRFGYDSEKRILVGYDFSVFKF